ncbi:MAG: glycosyltransferase [Candidatus Symbiopectobacterium sp. Dall1.0]|nr:glycosyltransferase [Candidatus Symbiopectobacterium sp. Dall1.0]
MKVLHLCYSDLSGGAARAAYRIHIAQRRFGIDSHMLVIKKLSDNDYVHTVSKWCQIRIKILNFVATNILKFKIKNNLVLHSMNTFPSGVVKYINKLNPQIVNLHWIGCNMLSIHEVSKIQQQIVWTLHDMWAFSGCEHYEDLNSPCQYVNGYKSEGFFTSDLNKIIYYLKVKKWKRKKFHLIAPSHWMGDCAKNSFLFKGSKINVISNCIDHEKYKPVDKQFARYVFGLPKEKKLILFGAMSSTSDVRKGYSLLKDALAIMKNKENVDDIELVIFGASKGSSSDNVNMKEHYLGTLADDVSLSLLYSAVDIFVAPSLQDNLPNTLVESLASGTPCVAFNIGGMSDLISSEIFGSLVDEVDSNSLADSIITSLKMKSNPNLISEKSAKLRNESSIAQQYYEIYKLYIN